MNEQINRINNADHTIVTDDASHYGGISQMGNFKEIRNGYSTFYVK